MKNKIKTIAYVVLLCITTSLNAQDLSALFKELDPSVVTIEVVEYKVKDQQINASSGLGSGVIINKEGFIITAAHVVESANKVSVKLQNGVSFEADVISSSTAADLALLKLRIVPSNLKPAKSGTSTYSEIGEQILVIGAPLGLDHSLSVGYISRKMKKNVISNGEMAGFIQTDASINQGNSGGPMFNMKGELIGIVSFILSNSGGFEGLGFAVDIDTAKKVLFDVNSFWTGFDGLFLSEGLAGIFNTPQASGVLVQRITPHSFADKIGLKPGIIQAEILGQKLWLGGDIILSIQGMSCSTPHDLGNIKTQIENLKAGDQVLIEVLRKGKRLTLEANFKQ
ncbi:trypsin-like peptidase domain-containing protein [Cellulophaga sp. HaHa_2_95]|uniref:S1C family serine protease n=1 Tax=unclassified Cellulophaga TaxID=2634405 RepID=UPI001C4FA22E|nr:MULTISPECIES: trypsin-like peptidase domain-containing protein [unclassified Cellulophaga]QXP53079.1 trypsin-like peptidase domain-containing protein [Cellulophaga sp. HaHa_2_1]QXP54636.1 trypsin-like peptidase domain-containing protein [Cellulophaga sp. HaHa_2_95]